MKNQIILVFTVLLTCQLAGEVLTLTFHLPVPGPVIGMVLLFCGLVIHGSVPQPLSAVTGELLGNLSLLFVPAGVGVMLHARLLADNWLALSAGLVLSTAVALAVTGALMQWASRWTERRAGRADAAQSEGADQP